MTEEKLDEIDYDSRLLEGIKEKNEDNYEELLEMREKLKLKQSEYLTWNCDDKPTEELFLDLFQQLEKQREVTSSHFDHQYDLEVLFKQGYR